MNKLYEENDIQNIANAIRGKNGSTDTYKVSEMASAINDIPSGGNLEDFIPEEAFHFTGNCQNIFAYDVWDWFLKKYGDKIATSDITSAISMFLESSIKELPFDLNFADGGCTSRHIFNSCKQLESVRPIDFKQTSPFDVTDMFNACEKLKEIGKLSNLYPTSTSRWFRNCYYLRHLPEFENLNLSYVQANNTNCSYMVSYNCSLRKISEDLLKQIYGVQTSPSYTIFNYGFTACYVLDEIIGMNPKTGTLTSNAFTYTFNAVSRAKDVIFATQENGVPYSANWKSQTIDLSVLTGYSNSIATIVSDYNSGITVDKRVTDDSSYQALKNDPDWFTTDINYSRYNHDSAVKTINSLPDTSAYLASNGGTNTIKFKGASGALTDGGAINTLTDAEIAVATAKGWTVAFV